MTELGTIAVLESAEISGPLSLVRTANGAANSGSVSGDLAGPSCDHVRASFHLVVYQEVLWNLLNSNRLRTLPDMSLLKVTR